MSLFPARLPFSLPVIESHIEELQPVNRNPIRCRGIFRVGYRPWFEHLVGLGEVNHQLRQCGALIQFWSTEVRVLQTEATPLLPLQCKKYSRVEGAISSTMSFCNCQMALANHKLGVDLLAIFFGIGAWIGINGMYVQLPLIVQTQPEGWNLPSYLSIIIQVANIGPISYTLLEKFWPNKVKDSWLICGILSLGSTSVILMAFLYQKTTYIGGEEHSTALFALVFFVALVGCTSSVLFMPFMRHFRNIYLISYYVGEGLSGFVPSIAALVQGVGGNPTCINQTYENGTSHVVSYTSPPRFSTQSFFIFLFCMFLLSNISFILLNNLNWCKTEKVYLSTRKNSLSQSGQNSPVAITRLQSEDKSISEEDNMAANRNAGFISSSNGVALYEEFSDPNQMAQSSSTQNRSLLSRRVYVYYLVLVSWLCLFGNGLFPGIQSYSCLPYGNVAYHLSVTLGSMANPLACFLAFFLPYSSVRATSLMALICTLISCYIATTAVLSPSPPLVGTTGGEALVVLSWVVFTGLISYIKVSVATLFRLEGGRALFWCGAVQQMGSAAGAILGFFLVNFGDIFHTYFPCQDS
uniref:Riboflavin transporter n=1 Tax=Timema douglasi TaxID=61478 RepID=A0A7R8VMC8_TIMDO|nr:unnamed protein product [Timema douglasi]